MLLRLKIDTQHYTLILNKCHAFLIKNVCSLSLVKFSWYPFEVFFLVLQAQLLTADLRVLHRIACPRLFLNCLHSSVCKWHRAGFRIKKEDASASCIHLARLYHVFQSYTSGFCQTEAPRVSDTAVERRCVAQQITKHCTQNNIGKQV